VDRRATCLLVFAEGKGTVRGKAGRGIEELAWWLDWVDLVGLPMG
jgi:hypothetical protein